MIIKGLRLRHAKGFELNAAPCRPQGKGCLMTGSSWPCTQPSHALSHPFFLAAIVFTKAVLHCSNFYSSSLEAIATRVEAI